MSMNIKNLSEIRKHPIAILQDGRDALCQGRRAQPCTYRELNEFSLQTKILAS